MNKEFNVVGRKQPIEDAVLKVSGELEYVGDMSFSNMLHGKILYSPIAHGKIKSINTEKAEALPGVKAIVTYKNSPQIPYNSAVRFYEHKIPEVEYVFSQTVRFVGDRVAAVAAIDEQTARKAIGLIEVEYEELPAIFDCEEALKEDAIKIHEDGNIIGNMIQESGDIKEGFSESDYIFEDKYIVPPVHHGAIENHIAIAKYSKDGKLTVWSPNQNTYGYRIALSKIFQLPMNKVRVISPAIGGSFGGKLEMTIEPVAALLSMVTGNPVRVELSRSESITSTRTRHGAVIYIKTGVKKDGTIQAQEMKVIANTGAYASSALNVIGAMSHKVFKLYKVKNMKFHGIPVYTNTPIAGAMRGYGSPQAFFAQQVQLNKIAKKLNMDMVDIQLKNLVEPTDLDPRFNKPHGNPRPIDCVIKGREVFKWHEVRKTKNTDRFKYGIGMAVGAHGNGVFGAHRDATTLMMKINEDGSAVLYTGSHDMGNGSISLQMQIISEVLGISEDNITCIKADTDTTPWHLGDYASRGTFVVGSAAKKVAESIKKQLIEEAIILLNEAEENLVLSDNLVWSKIDKNKKATLCELVVHAQSISKREITAIETFNSIAGVSSYGAHFAEVEVDTETGTVKVLNYVAVHDVGKAINPMSVEGQIEGAIQMGIGYALTEGLEFDQRGKVKNNTFKKYHLINSMEMPETKVLLIEEGEDAGPFGAKSIGECSVVPVAPAVTNAVANALDIEFNQLPLKPERILSKVK